MTVTGSFHGDPRPVVHYVRSDREVVGEPSQPVEWKFQIGATSGVSYCRRHRVLGCTAAFLLTNKASTQATSSAAPMLEPHDGFWKMAQAEVHWRKQTMSSILFGIAALLASIGLLVLCSGVGLYFLSNSKSKLAGRF
jgi:hypothetical protein